MKTAVWFLLVVIAVAAVGRETPNPAGRTAFHSEHCPMWKIWHEGADAGVPAGSRYGWPDPQNRYFNECPQ